MALFGDADIISHSRQSQAADPLIFNERFTQSKFRQFLNEYREGGVAENFAYRELLSENYDSGKFVLRVQWDHINDFDPSLAETLLKEPMRLMPLLEAAAVEVLVKNRFEDGQEERPRIQVQLTHLKRAPVKVRELSSDNIAKLVRVPGIVISASKPSCKATKITLMCTNCRTTMQVQAARAFGMIQIPRRCPNQEAGNSLSGKQCPLDPFMVLADKSQFLDVQKLKLQEKPDDIPTGEMPRHIWLFCERYLVNQVKPGAHVNIVGIYKIFESKVARRGEREDSSVRRPYIEVLGIEEMNETQQKGVFAEQEVEDFRELAHDPLVADKVAKSIAPAIWGNEDIKKAIACLMFGGSRKKMPDGMNLRGDINVLLLGDPSVAKSQFLKFVMEVAPVGVYTSGKGSSAAGLTASVIKEPGTGEFHLEGGAMVLADGGVVCIDEFDKMREQDRVAIHEAMEQQTISIAKAGITTILNSRTSVLAAANPIFGRYDDLRTTNENIDFETTILSRFDLIFIIRDLKDRERDRKLAQHIMDLHIKVDQEDRDDAEAAPIPADLLSKYVAYARHFVHPRLSPQAADMLKNHYVTFRQEAKQREDETGEPSAIPLTVRQLESLVRISEALAKMELAEEANEDHVKEAVRLFKVATLRAARQGEVSGEGALHNRGFQDAVQKAERNIRRMLAVGSSTSVKKLTDEMVRRNIAEAAVRRALDVMHARSEVEYRNRRRQVYRKK